MSTTAKAPGKAKVTTPSERSFTIERTFNAPRELVWKAMTDPALLAQWWGRGNRLVVEKFEPKKGGHWRFVEHAPDGIQGFEGRFREVTPPSRMVQTFEWDFMPGYPIVNTLELEDLGDGRTRLKATSLFYEKDERDGFMQTGFEGGMNQSYDALDKVLEKMS